MLCCVFDSSVTTSSRPQLWTNNVCTDANQTTGSQFSGEFNEVWGTKQWRPLGKIKRGDILVIGDATVDDCLLAGVDDNEGEVDDRVGRRGSVRLLL